MVGVGVLGSLLILALFALVIAFIGFWIKKAHDFVDFPPPANPDIQLSVRAAETEAEDQAQEKEDRAQGEEGEAQEVPENVPGVEPIDCE